jgi:hypothetical protein
MNLFHEIKKQAREESINEVSRSAMVQKAIDIATSMSGNYTGAFKRIEKIKKGLSKDKNVAKALKLANEETVSENYRTAARHGMGTEGKKEARIGLELDYYDKTGAKYMGKIVKKDSKGYTVKDDKSGKMHTFVYHDRIKARKFLQKVGEEMQEGKGTDIFQKYSKVISRLSSKEQDEILDALYTMNTQSGGKTKEAHSKVKELLNLDYTPEGDNIQEKVEYAEYKFRNKRDAQKALDYFKSQQLIDLNINDDGLSQGELAIDAGTKDMTKYHKEVLKKFKPKVLTTEMASAQQAAIAIAKKKKNESVMDAYREMWEEKLDEEMISYRVKKMQKPEEDKFKRSAKMMGLKITMDKGRDDTVIVMSGTKKKLRDFDAVARGKSSFGDPSTIRHFDEK